MPEPDLLHELSDELRQAFVWAQAMELDAEVGTRTVLIGMMRVGRGESDVEQLLRTFEISPDALYAALQDVAPQWRIDPSVSMPLSGVERLVLTSNVERAVRLASANRSPRRWSSGPVQPSELFGAILGMPDSTGYRGLELALGGRASLGRVADAHVRYLEDPGGRSFGEVLQLRLGEDESPAPDSRELRPPDSRLPACALALASDRNAYAVAYAGGGVALWDDDWPDGRPVHASSTEATALAFSPSGDRLAIALEDGSVLTWAAASDEVEDQLEPTGERRLSGIAWSPDGDRLVSAGAEGTLHEWRLGTSASARATTLAAVPLRAVAWPAGAGPVALGDDGRLHRRDRPSETLSVLPADAGSMYALSADGRRVAVAGAEGPITVFDIQSGAVMTVVRGLRDSLLSLALSPDGTRVAYVGAGGAVSVDEVSLPVRVGDHVEWLSDRYAEVDRLGREGLADAIATRLDRISGATPDESFLIHLDGPWGAGKSTILHFLRERLEDRWLIVDFDAWRQARVGPPWWALLTSLRRALRRRLGWGRGTWLRMREMAARVGRDHTIAATAVLVITAVLAYLLVAPDAVSLPAWVALIAWAAGAVTLLLGPGRGLAAFLMWDSAMGAKRYEQWHRDPMEGLAEHFEWLVTHSPWPILFFVDDLDRCDEGHVVDLLDSIQTLVRDSAGGTSGAPCFVVAADGRWIRRSYERTHEGFDEAIGEPGRPLGYLFLDKLFQLTVEVPTIGRAQQETYLRHLLLGVERVGEASDGLTVQERIAGIWDEQGIVDVLNNASPRERAAATPAAIKRLSAPSVERATEHDLQKFAGVLERNPRSMKRFVNAYSMALVTALLEGRRVDREDLARWTVLRLRWPDLAEHLRERPERLEGLYRSPVASDLPGRLAELGASPELSRVLDFDGSRLSSDAIRDLTGT